MPATWNCRLRCAAGPSFFGLRVTSASTSGGASAPKCLDLFQRYNSLCIMHDINTLMYIHICTVDSVDATMNQNYNQLQEVNYAVCNNSEESVWILAIFTADTLHPQYLSITFNDCLKEWLIQSVFPTDKRLSAGSSRVVTFDQSSGLTGPHAPKSSPLMVQQRSQLASGHLWAVPSAQNTGIPFHTRRTPGSIFKFPEKPWWGW